MFEGELAGIFVGPDLGGPMTAVDEAVLVAGRGIEGDRYAAADDDASGRRGRDVTLIEAEAVEAAAEAIEGRLEPGETRRNLLTRGVPLNHLVGQRFRVGAVVLEGVRLCEPCEHLEQLTRPGVRPALVHRGGLRADVVEGGTVRRGDTVHIC